jgi:hypothetical protein
MSGVLKKKQKKAGGIAKHPRKSTVLEETKNAFYF